MKKFKLQFIVWMFFCGVSILQATEFDEFGIVLPAVAVDLHENGTIILSFDDGERLSIKRHESFAVNLDQVDVVLDSATPKQGYVLLTGATPWQNEKVEFSLLSDAIESFEVQIDIPPHSPEESYSKADYALDPIKLPKPVGFDLPDGEYVPTPTTPKKIYYFDFD